MLVRFTFRWGHGSGWGQAKRLCGQVRAQSEAGSGIEGLGLWPAYEVNAGPQGKGFVVVGREVSVCDEG